MGKRPLDHLDPAEMSTDKAPKKTERSHEENQERAYIAASRRSDRSIEARIQSARMASEIHKRRTGKGFKITEEIVRKEEMYEEEEDEIPRHYRALAAQLHTRSPSMNQRANAYLTTQLAAAAIAHEADISRREADISRRFAEHFPNVPTVSRQFAQGMYAQSLPQQQTPMTHPYQPTHHFASPPPMGYHLHHRSQSVANITPLPQVSFGQFDHHRPTMSRHASFDDTPPALTPGSGSTQTPSASGTPPLIQRDEFRPRGYSTPAALPVDPSLHPPNGNVPTFTSEIPVNVKEMTDMNSNDPAFLSGFIGGELAGSDIAMWPTDYPPPRDVPIPSSEYESFQPPTLEQFQGVNIPQMNAGVAIPYRQAPISTPAPNAELNTDLNTDPNADLNAELSVVNDDVWREFMVFDDAEPETRGE